MAIPSVPERRLMAAGFRKGATWNTPLATGAGLGALLESDGGLTRNQPYLPAREADTPFVLEGDLGPVDPITFAPEFTMRYDLGGIGVALACLFGTAGTPVAQGGGVEEHVFQWADHNYGKFITFAEEKLSKIWEVSSAKPVGFDLSIADGFLKGSLSLIGSRIIDDPSVNGTTQMDAITYATRAHRIKFSHVNVKMNNQASGDVGAETSLEISDIAIHYERPHDSPHKGGSDFIIEPAENGHPIITVTLTFPRMSSINNAYFKTDFIGEVEKKMRLWFQGNLISGSLYYMLKIYFPRLRVINVAYTWDEIIPASITLQAEEAASAPIGMTYARPHITIQNTRTTDYLTA